MMLHEDQHVSHLCVLACWTCSLSSSCPACTSFHSNVTVFHGFVIPYFVACWAIQLFCYLHFSCDKIKFIKEKNIPNHGTSSVIIVSGVMILVEEVYIIGA